MLKTHSLYHVEKCNQNIWILKDKFGIGFGVIGSVSDLVSQGLIECDAGQPVFSDKFVYTFLESERTSSVYSCFADCLRALCNDPRIDRCSGLARIILSRDILAGV